MMVGVFSDVHDNLSDLERALDRFRAEGAGTLLFCGDFCSPIPARVIGAYDGAVHCVFGNGDGDRYRILQAAGIRGSALHLHGEHAEIDVGERRVALTHFPLYGRALARTGDYDAVFSGHTHERHEERLGSCLWVNPGEVLGWKGPPTAYVWDTDANAGRFIELR